jgi:hypothetical protein
MISLLRACILAPWIPACRGLSRGNVPDGQLFTPQNAAAHLLRVIDRLTPADTGKCFDWAGKEIPA